MPRRFNTAPCPFCGTDAANWDTKPCDHLIADYGDGTDGDRGILCGGGGSRCGNRALECLDRLKARASRSRLMRSSSRWGRESLTY
jgi:hypothetical protein